jgi:hypothetical protein
MPVQILSCSTDGTSVNFCCKERRPGSGTTRTDIGYPRSATRTLSSKAQNREDLTSGACPIAVTLVKSVVALHLDEHRDRLAAHRARLALSREHIGAVSARELVPAGYGDVRLGVPMKQMEHVVPPPKVEVSSAMVGRAQPRWAPPPSVFPQLAPSQLGETTPGGRGYRNN